MGRTVTAGPNYMLYLPPPPPHTHTHLLYAADSSSKTSAALHQTVGIFIPIHKDYNYIPFDYITRIGASRCVGETMCGC